jgi:hypothetical protein
MEEHLTNVTKDAYKDYVFIKLIDGIKHEWPQEWGTIEVNIQHDNAPAHFYRYGDEFVSLRIDEEWNQSRWNFDMDPQAANSPDENILE